MNISFMRETTHYMNMCNSEEHHWAQKGAQGCRLSIFAEKLRIISTAGDSIAGWLCEGFSMLILGEDCPPF